MSKLNLKRFLVDNELDLSLNNIEDVPVKDIASFSKVTVLDLSCNLINNLPEDFSTLTRITKLDLSKNRLTSLPASFGSLEGLQYLDLRGNQLTSLPPSFGRLSRLRWLDLKDNPLNDQLSQVAGDCLDEKQCQECAKRIVSYMKDVEVRLEKERGDRLRREKKKEAERESQRSAERQRQRAQKKAEKDRKRREYLEHKAISDQLEQGDGPEDSDEVLEETPSAELRPTTSSRLSLVTCVVFSALMAFVYVFFFCHEQRSTMCLSLNKHLPAGLIDWRGHVINATTSLLAR